MSTEEGPLTKLSKLLGVDPVFAPIAAVKRIEDRPRKLNTPDDLSDTQIEKLSTNPELLFHVPEIDLRGRELEYNHEAGAPPGQVWTCVDQNTFDPISEGGESACIGRGATQKEALNDLLDQLAEYPKPRASRTIFSSPFEPSEYSDKDVIDRDEADFDDGLDDAP